MKSLNKSLANETWLLRFSIGGFFLLAILFSGTENVRSQAIVEGFDVVSSNTAAPLPNWVAVNNSTTTGTTGWFQGEGGLSTQPTFPSQSGAATSYIAANYNNTTNSDDISNWLISPNRTFKNGDTVTFWTRTTTASQFPDRLQVRLSANGNSTNVGSGPTGIGDFTTLLLDINPSLAVGGYPEIWTLQTITVSGLAGPTSGRLAFRYFVTSGGPGGVNSNYIGIDTFAYKPAAPKAPLDFNGDGTTDFSVVRNTGGGSSGQITWFNCYNGIADPACRQVFPFGLANDYFVPADYDGDGKADIAIWRPDVAGAAGFWIFESSTNTSRFESCGQYNDDPSIVADYTGDSKADPAVYREGVNPGDQSFWFYRASSGPYKGQIVYEPWGSAGDLPSPGDYDGDGSADFMVQRDVGNGQSNFWLRTNKTNNVSIYVFGLAGDWIVPGDYDGDGKTDIAVARSIGGMWNWYYRSSITGNVVWLGPFGFDSDSLVQGDYDGDGKTDIAVWRADPDPAANYFFYLGSMSGFKQFEWGMSGDFPVASYNNR